MRPSVARSLTRSKPRAFENGSAIAVILDDHVGRDAVPVALGVGDQGLGLTGNRVAISLLLARDPRVKGCDLHARLLCPALGPGFCELDRAPGSRRRSGVWRRADGRRHKRGERWAESPSGVQPCRSVSEKMRLRTRATISPMEWPLLLACARKVSARVPGILIVIGISSSAGSAGWPMARASWT